MNAVNYDELKEMVKEALAELIEESQAPRDPEKDPETIYGGPFDDAIDSMNYYVDLVSLVSQTLALTDNVMTMPALYNLMADIINLAVDGAAVADSEQSWLATANAFKERAKVAVEGREYDGAVVVPMFTDAEFGAGQRMCNELSLLLRDSVARAKAYGSDPDLGRGGQPLTVAECIRICFGVLDKCKKLGVFPFENDTAFQMVRDELYQQYKAMGDGLFGNFPVPGGSTPWSWAGGGS